MGSGRWYTIAGVALLVGAGALVVRTWSGTSAGQFDPVGAVIGLAGLAASLVAVGQGVRAQRQADINVAEVAAELAIDVRDEETEARRQLLGGHYPPINVGFSLVLAQAYNVAGAAERGRLEQVVDYYTDLQTRRMVITGVGGSGKTMLAIDLILGLLAERGEEEPVPVRMPATRLDMTQPSRTAVREWLVVYLRENFGLREAAARQLVKAGMVLPVLDGLDEVDAVGKPDFTSRAAHVIRACNEYLQGTGKAAVVLTCRSEQYKALEQAGEWVHDAAWIRLRSIELAAARTFIRQRVTEQSRWQPVLEAMEAGQNQALVKALSTPWRLTLATTVYEQRKSNREYERDPSRLVDSSLGLDTPVKIRDHLLGLYIPATVATAQETGRVSYGHRPDHVRIWLTTLARHLKENAGRGRRQSGADIVLHELWPLAGDRPRMLTTALAGGAAFMLLVVPLLSYGVPFRFMLTFLGAAALARMGRVEWPRIWRIELPRPKTETGRRKLMAGAVFGLLSGLILGVTLGLARGAVPGIFGGLVVGLGFALGSMLLTPGTETAVLSPRSPIRTDLVVGLIFGLQPVLALTLAYWLTVGFEAGIFWLLWPLFWFEIMLASRRAATRYLMLILCTRGRLPWRLGRFLHWCYGAGLLRVAGIGYQFRHRELRDYLARHPIP